MNKTKDYYFDTSIWLDIFERRGRNELFALRLVKKIIDDNSKIIYSDFVLNELRYLGYSQHKINYILAMVDSRIKRKVHIYTEEKDETKNLSTQREVPFGDALHAIICRDNDLQLVSRDKDFEKLKDITEAKNPEDLI